MRSFAAVAMVFCAVAAGQEYVWQLRRGFPAPAVPAGNPMSAAKVELGRLLFYDKRMSGNESQSCASCHKQELAFTDGLARAKGSTGQLHPRSSMSLANVAYAPFLTWADGAMRELEPQALVPMRGLHPVELGFADARFLAMARQDPAYRKLFAAAFPGEPDSVTVPHIAKAISAFERTLISTSSPYDRYRYGRDDNAISQAAKRGEIVFFSSEKAGCFQCHGGWNFSGAIRYAGQDAPPSEPDFHDTAVHDPGGRFRAPTLRNIAVTAPYMHDGGLKTLKEVVDFYVGGGSSNEFLDRQIKPLTHLAQQERADLVAFLESLSGEAAK